MGKDFTDRAFLEGMAERSGRLGDPAGSARHWVVGGDREEPLVVQVASDDPEDLSAEVARIEDSVYSGAVFQDRLQGSGASVVFKQGGANLPGPLAGHEHFVFLDGVSQPGLRGLVSASPDDVLAARHNPNKRDQPPVPGVTKGQPAQGKPGQDLLWPGEFVFGYPTQAPQDDPDWDGPNPAAGPPSVAGPDWAWNGCART